jgi:hypothetical protein
MDTEGNNISNLDVEELASLARRYYGARFPNPQRLGCPPPGELIKLIGQRQIPDESLRAHLFECSECFGEYRQSLAQCRRPATDKSVWRNRLASIINGASSAGVLKISSALVSAILILSSLILIWRKVTPEAGKVVAFDSAPSEHRAGDDARNGAGAATNLAAPSGVGVPSPPRDALAMVGVGISATGAETYVRPEKVDIDLENFQVVRQSLRETRPEVSGDRPYRKDPMLRGKSARDLHSRQSEEGETIISLPPTRARVVLRLPETAAPGIYNVSLINAFGKPLFSTSAVSQDGAKLRVELDLRRISPKKCRLRLARNGEAPAFYDVIIGAR